MAGKCRDGGALGEDLVRFERFGDFVVGNLDGGGAGCVESEEGC